MRRLGALALLLTVTACSGSPPVEDGPEQLDVLDAGSQDLESWPWLPGSLPRRVPTDAGALPTVAADPPGRALLAVHVGERLDDPWEWAAENILVHGIDGRWRRLDLAGLGLSGGAPYVDSYGAGDLSPNGRWWVGRAREGVVLVDLGKGRVELVELGRGGGAQIAWLSDNSGFLVQGRRPGGSDLVDLRTRSVESRAVGLGTAGLGATGPGAGTGLTVTETGSGERWEVAAATPCSGSTTATRPSASWTAGLTRRRC